jgi:hypothetical protein
MHRDNQWSATKKLRSPDLVNAEQPQSNIFYYAFLHGCHSQFFDTMLAYPMQESITREIKFPRRGTRTVGSYNSI